MTKTRHLARRLKARTSHERRLLATTTFLFLAAHVLVRVCRLGRTRSILSKLAGGLARAQDAVQLEWAVAAVSSNLPGRHSCLIEALCCAALASRSGIAAEFRLGAARDGEIIHFHAWVEYAGQTLCGSEAREFVPLV